MAKFAVITQFNWSYRYGFNAVVNGLDYHNNKDIDVHVIYNVDVPKDYLDKLAVAFDFDVIMHPQASFSDAVPKPVPGEGQRWIAHERWPLEFYKYKLAQNLAPDYDAIMLTDADYLVLGDVTNYFRSVVGNDLLITAHNSYGRTHSNGFLYDEYPNFIDEVEQLKSPVMNHPFFCDPKRNIDFYQRVIDFGQFYAQDILPFNQALYDMRRFDDLIVLPSTLWGMFDATLAPINYMMQGRKRCFELRFDKMMMIHNHWWNRPGIMHSLGWYITEAPDIYVWATQNVNFLCDECREINTTWKLPLEWNPNLAHH